MRMATIGDKIVPLTAVENCFRGPTRGPTRGHATARLARRQKLRPQPRAAVSAALQLPPVTIFLSLGDTSN